MSSCGTLSHAENVYAYFSTAEKQVVVVADSSKLIRRNISIIAKVEQISLLITDDGAPPSAVEALRRRGVEVQLV